MGSTRRAFTDEYKASAVGFVLDEHRSVAEVARNIDVHEMTLGTWDYKAAKAENAQLQMQVSFAKKVATWFANDQQ